MALFVTNNSQHYSEHFLFLPFWMGVFLFPSLEISLNGSFSHCVNVGACIIKCYSSPAYRVIPEIGDLETYSPVLVSICTQKVL